MKNVYFIDLKAKHLEVCEFYDEADLEACLAYENVKSWRELDTYDFKVFDSELKADAWLEKYTKTLKGLSNSKICLSRKLPAMLYKRRYMIQSIMGEKLQTYRDYLKPWTHGQLFNLHDQVYFLTVRLLSINETDEGYCYRFKLP